MKNKSFKILTKCIITVIISVLLILLGVQNFAIASQITISNVNNMSYKVNSNQMFTFEESTGTYTNLYCINAGAHRNSGDVLTVGGSIYNLNDEMITALFRTRERYNSFLWLIDNMYVSNSVNAETKAIMMENISNLIKSKEGLIETTYNVKLDDDWIDGMIADYSTREQLIYVVQQCVMWQFTNNYDPQFGDITTLQGIGIKVPGDGKDESTEYTKTKYYTYIYTAMTALAEDNKNYVSKNASSMQTYINNLSLDSTNVTVDRKNGKIGPFILKNHDSSVLELIKYTVTINDSVLDEQYYDIITDSNNITIQLKNGYELKDENEYTINLKINVKTVTTDAQYFYTEGNLVTKQPLVDLKKKGIGITLQGRVVTEPAVEFDLHLIKNITDIYVPVDNNGTVQYVLSKTDKAGAEKAATVLVNRVFSRIGNLSHGATTDVYLTNKVFATVPTGAIIKYKITIHNEGDLDGYAEEITDTLANGLEYVSLEQLKEYGISETVDYGWVSKEVSTPNISAAYSTKYLSSEKSANNLIKAYDAKTNTIDSKEVYIYCKVTSKDSNDTLKNVAEITADKAYDAINEYKDVADRDSTPLSISKEQITSQINTWQGSSSTSPMDMDERAKYSVPGLEDDDDFENLRVETFDLALTKQIVNVKYEADGQIDSTAVSGRLKYYRTAALLENTTASYIMNKPAYGVKTGAVVKYRITVYNESNINGYATEITDYLPQGLEFVSNSEVNQKYGWVAVKNEDGTTTVKTTYLKDRELIAYTGGTTLDSDYVEIECKVVEETVGKTLTNIAEISKYGYYIDSVFIEAVADENGKTVVDRDSYQNSVQEQLGNKTYAETIAAYEVNIANQANRNLMDKTNYDVEDDDDFEQLIVKDREYDLALRKYISAVNGNNVVNNMNLTSYAEMITRIPYIDLNSETIRAVAGTATYAHGKEAIEVYPEDEITYTIRVYNEGSIADYNGIATEITDYLPQGVEFVKLADGYDDYTASVNEELNAVIIKYQGNKILPVNSIKKIAECVENKAYDQISDEWYQEVALICKVTTYEPNVILTNRAEITSQIAYNENNEIVENISDRDSVANSLIAGVSSVEEKIAILNLDNYYTDYVYGINDIYAVYYPGVEGTGTSSSQKQDDTDFENIKVKKLSGQYDIQLVKIDGKNSNKKLENVTFELTTKINGITNTVTLGPTNSNGLTEKITTTIENMDVDIYTIKEVNVGENEYVTLKDDLDIYVTKTVIGTTFRADDIYFDKADIENVEKNYNYGDIITKVVELTDGRTVEISATLSNNGLIEIVIPNLEEQKDFDLALRKFITGVTNSEGTIEKTDRYPVFRVDENGNYTYKHSKDPVIVDTNNIVTYTLRVYNEGETYGYASEILDDIPEGLEFVPYTEGDGSINDQYGWTMYKIVSDIEIAQLPKNIEIREFDGVVTENGVELKKCIVTTDVKEADYIVTEYLSYENGKLMVSEETIDPETLLPYNPNLLKPFDNSVMSEPDYRDVKVQFKVVEPETSDRIIINLAQITEDSDKYNEDVEDIDSTPNEWIDGEDDQDIEKIRVRYFDLALVKWVSEAIVIEDGVEKIEKGNTLEELQEPNDHRLIYALAPETIGEYTDLEPIVKVDIPKNKLDSVVVKFKYQIRVWNEGQIDGYATEITDYIPSNMKFVQEDNPLWKEVGDGKVVTNQLANTLLTVGGQPETIEIVYTWINGENNLGLLVNTAEISADYNESDTPDIDSTPNNFTVNEDDIDDAPVLLSIRTGDVIEPSYIILGFTVVAIIATGIILIKKYVL